MPLEEERGEQPQFEGTAVPEEIADKDVSSQYPTTGKAKEGKKSKKGKKARKAKSLQSGQVLVDGVAAKAITPSDFPDTRQEARGREAPHSTIPNYRYLLTYYGVTVQYDVIGKDVLINVPGLEGCPDNARTASAAVVKSLLALNGMSKGNFDDFIVAIANRNQVNPVADWITSKPWDGEDRVSALCETLQVQSGFPEELRDLLVERWLMSAIAAAMMPSGFSTRGVLVLQGPQSIGKTRWVMSLVPDQAFQERFIKIDHHLDASDKDSKLTALRHWIVEIGELDSSFKKDVARLKGFITANKDKIRVPYARSDSEFSRRTVFCATVNKDDFLVDDTGNTRWWTIPVKNIDYEHGIDMQQVFAQVNAKFQEGEAQWWLTKDEEALLESFNEDHQSTTAVREVLQSNIDFVSSSQSGKEPIRSATEILQILGIAVPTNAQTRDAGGFLKQKLGDPKKSNGKRGWRVRFKAEFDTTLLDGGVY